MNLDGRVAIITGAARGLGREYACALAAEGAVEASGGKAFGLNLDVTDSNSTQAMADAAIGGPFLEC